MTERNSSERRHGPIRRPDPADDEAADGRALLWLQVLQVMRRLDSDDAEAAFDALAELNGIRGWFDWETLAPKEMAATQRARVVRLLQLMAGTTSVGEARNAYRTALRMMEADNRGWHWKAA